MAYARSLRSIDSGIEITYLFHRHSRFNSLGIGIDFIALGVKLISVCGQEEVICLSKGYDLVYYVTSDSPGSFSWLQEMACRTLLHQVGYQQPDYNSATYFAYTSYWQSLYFTGGTSTTIPYIIEDPVNQISKDEAREELGIPREAIVLGRHGGSDTWNLPFASKVVTEVAKSRRDLFFIFCGTPPFCSEENIRFFPGTHKYAFLESFIGSADAMLHARWEGETFGMACAEFLIRQKPIITWGESRERNHILLADRSAIFFNTPADLTSTLLHLDRQYILHKSGLVPVDHLHNHYSSSKIGTMMHGLLVDSGSIMAPVEIRDIF